MVVAVTRRDFLARTGVLGAASVAAQVLAAPAARAQAGDALLAPVLAELSPALQQLAHDAIAALGVFVIPGPDPWSVQQGLTDEQPGAVEADNPRFLLDILDFDFVPLSDTGARALTQALATATVDLPLPPEVNELLQPFLDGSSNLDDLLLPFTTNDQVIPVGLVIALYLNYAASLVNPAAVVPVPFTAPFANLTWEEKAAALEMIETQQPELLAGIDSNLPEPVDETVSGLLKFAAGALLEYAAYGSLTEFAMFDPDDPPRLRDRPVGWQLTGYQPGRLESVHGWDELLGYHNGVQAVEGSWQRGDGVFADG